MQLQATNRMHDSSKKGLTKFSSKLSAFKNTLLLALEMVLATSLAACKQQRDEHLLTQDLHNAILEHIWSVLAFAAVTCMILCMSIQSQLEHTLCKATLLAHDIWAA